MCGWKTNRKHIKIGMIKFLKNQSLASYAIIQIALHLKRKIEYNFNEENVDRDIY